MGFLKERCNRCSPEGGFPLTGSPLPMSILNVWIEQDRAVVAVDTGAMSAVDGSVSRCVKLLPIMHQSAVLAVRGTNLFFSMLFMRLADLPGDFDALVCAIERLSMDTLATMRELYSGQLERPEIIEGFEVVLVGWSPAKGAIYGVSCARSPESGEVVIDEFPMSYVAPWDTSMWSVPDPKTPAEMVAVSRIQANLLATKAKDTSAADSDLVIAKVHRHRVTLELRPRFCDVGTLLSVYPESHTRAKNEKAG